MEILEIFLAAAGILIIIVSFVLSDKKEKPGIQEIEVDTKAIDDMLKQKQVNLTEEIDRVFTEKGEQAANRTEDMLSRITNEKIMAVNEFSDQVLEKIEMNHKEVVFLYDMLNEKERELKELLSRADKEKNNFENRLLRKEEDSKAEQNVPVKKENHTAEASSKREEEKTEEERLTGQQALKARQAAIQVKAREKEKRPVETAGGQNNKILDLYREGKSITEISKILGQGQGEVKLVIDLFLEADRRAEE